MGYSRSVVYLWRRRGRAGEEPYATFARDLDRARQQAAMGMLGRIRAAAHQDWRAAAWYLEHVEPSVYGDRLEIRTSPTKIARLAQEAGVSEAEMLAEITALQQQLAADDADE
jgi:uncharacterized protein YidB (DUF937 family)